MVVRCLPGPVPPVKVTRSTRGSRTSASVIVLRSPTNVLSIAGGSPASYSSSVRRIATSGVLLDGLSSTGTPAAIAGASLCATWLSGWLNGVIAATRPSGSRIVKIFRAGPFFAASQEKMLSSSRNASAAANLNTSCARPTS